MKRPLKRTAERAVRPTIDRTIKQTIQRTIQRQRGVTLIEVMSAMGIIAILASLNYPSLQQQIVRGRRAEAQAALLQLMQQQERYYSQNNRYLAFSSDSTDAAERSFVWWSGASAARSAYEIVGQACAGSVIDECIELRAMPGGPKVDRSYRDDACGTLTLTSAGVRAASGTAARCW